MADTETEIALPDRARVWTPLRIALIAIAGFAIALRTVKLLSLFPVLVDESIYLRWAEIIDHQGQWFISLLDAKQPLSYWIYALLRKGLTNVDPLVSARVVSVLAGCASTVLLFGLGKRLSGEAAGVMAALFYALLPYGVLYDRLAYTDAFVNCFALAIAVASVDCFRERSPTRSRALIAGVLLGLGIFTKSTVAQFALLPLVAAFIWQRRQPALAATRLAQIFTVAALFPFLSYLCVPDAPNFPINNLLLHHTSFFTPLAVLIENPVVNLKQNAILLFEYFSAYVTLGFAVVALASVVYLAKQRQPAAALACVAFVVPVLFQMIVLEYFPSRYVFPHIWPLILAAAVMIHRLAQSDRRAVAAGALAAIAAFSLGSGSIQLLQSPIRRLHPIDAAEFVSSGPFSGYGIQEAVKYLKDQASAGSLTVLTDPIWGTPADAIYPYLNRRYGIRVYDAWWTQMSDQEPLLPTGRSEVMKSQYERVTAGFVDFDLLPRVFYVTDTNYHTPADVVRRQQNARLVARFPKQNGRDSIDVYQLR